MSNYETWSRSYFGPDAERMLDPLNPEAIRCRAAFDAGWKAARTAKVVEKDGTYRYVYHFDCR